MKKLIIAIAATIAASQANAFVQGGDGNGASMCGTSSSYASCMTKFQRVDQQPAGLVSVYACNSSGQACMFGVMTPEQWTRAEQHRIDTGKAYLEY